MSQVISVAGNLKRHRRTHSGDKAFSCDQCSKSFFQAGDLKKHRRTHSGEKPFPCDQCPKSFSICSNVRRHTKTHNGEKDLPCNQDGNLKAHKIIHAVQKIKSIKKNHSEEYVEQEYIKQENNLQLLSHSNQKDIEQIKLKELLAFPHQSRGHKTING